MIGWLNPLALSALSLVAIPIVIHLLRTSRAEVVRFPSLRFLMPERTAAVRMRPPADPLLLIIRIAIVAAAVLAAAQPVIMTAGRLRAWNARTMRAIVIPAGAPSATRQAAEAEQRDARASTVIESASLGDGIARGVAWLDAAPPARREVVVVGPLMLGSLRERDVSSVPAGVGVRFVRASADPSNSRTVPVGRTLGAAGIDASMMEATVNGERTSAAYGKSAVEARGLQVLAPDGSSADVERLLRAVARDGAAAPEASEPIVVSLIGASPQTRVARAFDAATPRWMLRALLRLQSDQDLAIACLDSAAKPASSPAGAVALCHNAGGVPVVSALTNGTALIIAVQASASDLLSAVAIQAALDARRGAFGAFDQEVVPIPPADLTAWTRPTADVSADGWRRVDHSDARWLWLVVLLLLLIEHLVRRRTSAPAREQRFAA